MLLSRLMACTVCAASLLSVASCGDGNAPATPTLPSTSASATTDGATLKASSPVPMSPQADARLGNLRPVFTIANASGSHASIPLAYVFQITEGATVVHQSEAVEPGDGQTTYRAPEGLLKGPRTYQWRARAVHEGQPGPWSEARTFRTPQGDGPVPCGGSSGPEIIACVGAAYPDKLVKTSAGDFSLERRYANMEFIRDRIIETGKCKGVNLGRNNKRGTAEISRDFIVLRGSRGKGGRDRGVDIASGYDDVSSNLKLTWQVFDADKNWGHPFYSDYGPVDCSGLE
jgi:hypothetical protein